MNVSRIQSTDCKTTRNVVCIPLGNPTAASRPRNIVTMYIGSLCSVYTAYRVLMILICSIPEAEVRPAYLARLAWVTGTQSTTLVSSDTVLVLVES